MCLLMSVWSAAGQEVLSEMLMLKGAAGTCPIGDAAKKVATTFVLSNVQASMATLTGCKDKVSTLTEVAQERDVKIKSLQTQVSDMTLSLQKLTALETPEQEVCSCSQLCNTCTAPC